MIRLLALLLFSGIFTSLSAQITKTEKSDSRFIHRKGKLFLYYGWNRSTYSTSDIQFKGSGYNFTLDNVVAHDRPTHFDPKVYFNPTKITIPQYQYRVGYYINDKYSISWGFNHMKYVMDGYQTVKINGTINTPEAGVFNGSYDNQDIVLEKDFLTFEHTNGLNYLNFNLDRIETLWVGKHQRMSLSAVAGVGAGFMYPKSDVRLFGTELDKWHVAGYGVSTLVALRFEFLKNMFVQAQLEGGYINMPDILTTGNSSARAKQHFLYLEETVVIGGYIPLFTKQKSK
jgi:hypothetical protein